MGQRRRNRRCTYRVGHEGQVLRRYSVGRDDRRVRFGVQ